MFNLLRRFLELLPIPVVVKIGEIGGKIAHRYRHRERRICEVQLRYAMKRGGMQTDRSPEELTRAVFRHVGVFVAEAMILRKLLRRNSDGSYMHVENDDLGITEDLKKETRGVLPISGHIGCFELLAAYYADLGLKITAVGRELNFGFPNYLLSEYRRLYGISSIWRADNMGAREIVSRYRRGETVTSLIDQDTELPNRFAKFFGLPAAHPAGPLRIGVRGRVRIVSAFIVRTGIDRHKCITREIPYDPDDPDAEQKILEEFASRLEALVKQYPEQWIWWHRRWRREPGIDYDAHPEILRSTNDYLKCLEALSAQS